jgi:hypothetical protein
VAAFHLDLERELCRLHEELAARTYRPGPYRPFTIHEPKPRLISAACLLIRQGMTDPAALKDALWQLSGIDRLVNLVLTHFGNQAGLLKLHRLLGAIYSSCVAERLGSTAPATEQALNKVGGEWERFHKTEQRLKELEVLRNYHDGLLDLSPEESRWLLQITGEGGDTPAALLGLAEADDPKLLQDLTRDRLRHRQVRRQDPFAGRRLASAARVLANSYSRLLERLGG